MSTIEYAYRRFSRKRFPLPSEQQVDELERRIGTSFPEDYREFLLQFNGGWFNEPIIIPPSEDCPESHLTCLHGIGVSLECAELGKASDLVLFSENDPAQIIPIGLTPMADLIILIVREDGRGQIFFKKAFGDFFFLADGIEEFFGLLEEPPPDE